MAMPTKKSQMKTIIALLQLMTLKDIRGHVDIPDEDVFIRHILHNALANLLVQVDPYGDVVFYPQEERSTRLLYKELYGNMQNVIDVMTCRITKALAKELRNKEDVRLQSIELFFDNELAKLVLECRSSSNDEC